MNNNNNEERSSLFDLAKVDALFEEVGGRLHSHELEEADDHDERDEEHDEDAGQGVRVEVLLDGAIVTLGGGTSGGSRELD